MVALLPIELVQTIAKRCPCRESQIKQLVTYYNNRYPSPSTLVTYGLERTSQLEVVRGVLEARTIQYALVRSRDCLSQRHLLSKVFATCVHALGQESHIEQYERVESINALLGNLRKLFERAGDGQRLVLVLDGIDRQKQAGQTLLPALARLGDQIPGLSVIMTSSSPRPLALHKAGVAYVHFPPYTRAEAVYLVASSPAKLYPDPSADKNHAGVQIDECALKRLYAQFVVTVYDSVISSTSSTSIQTLRSTCEKLWPRFVWPLVSGETPPGKATTWDFAKLLVRNRGLFQAEGEKALHEHLQPESEAWSFADLALHSRQSEVAQVEGEIPSGANTPSKRRRPTPSAPGTPSTQNEASTSNSKRSKRHPPLLKQFPALLLLSSYLASTTPTKHDILLFSRLSSNSSHISKKIRRLKNTPTRRKFASNATSTNPDATPSKARITKAILSAAGGAVGTATVKPFSLERLLAILRAVHPTGIPTRFGRGISDKVYHELGELERLRLVVRAASGGVGAAGAGSASTGAAAASAEDATEEKWRVNVGRDWVVGMGKVWGLSVNEYEIEGDL